VPSRWVPVGGRRGGNSLAAWEGSAAVRSESAVLFCRFVLYIPLFCIVVVTVPSVCCSVKLPLSLPTSFCLFSFHSPPRPGGGRGGCVALLLLAAAETRTMSLPHPEVCLEDLLSDRVEFRAIQSYPRMRCCYKSVEAQLFVNSAALSPAGCTLSLSRTILLYLWLLRDVSWAQVLFVTPS